MTRPFTVLIVDDDKDLRDALCMGLEREGYELVTAADGREAIEYLRLGRPVDLIILDLMMPRMNGYQFREEQLGDAKLASIPVIVISAHGVRAETAQLGTVKFLRKPFDLDNLIAEIERVAPAPASA